MVEKQEMLVIGAGLARTGTNSIKEALEILLPGKCYHMYEAIAGGQSHKDFWARIVSEEATDDEIRDFFESQGFVSTVDYPSTPSYKRLLEVYPNAKVLLSVRDPLKWYQSVTNTILQFHLMGNKFPTSLYVKRDKRWEKMWTKGPNDTNAEDTGLFGSTMTSEEAAIRFFNQWIDDVKNTIPQDRLLIFDVKEGWEPLCRFLDVPIPKDSFPNVNDTAFMKKGIASIRRKSWAVALGVPLVLAGAFAAWKLLIKH